MFMKAIFVLEYPLAAATIGMTRLIMIFKVIFIVEMFITILAVIMKRTLNPVLL